jgi:putative acetyltransferase
MSRGESVTTAPLSDTSGELQLRRAREADAAAILEIKQDAIHGLARTRYGAEQLTAWAPDWEELDAFERAVEADGFVITIGLVDDDPVGYSVLNRDAARVDAVFVRPEYVRRGIATRLMSNLESAARFLDVDALTLTSSLNAVRFYESLGYWQRGYCTRTINEVTLRMVAMGKRL